MAMDHTRASLRFGALFTALTLLAPLAHAEPSAQDRATAQSFFDKGLALMKASKFSEACPLLEESQRLDPGMGTEFQLGKCYEGEGRVATAWVQYVDVADQAKATNQADRERIARQHANDLAPRVPHLTINVAESGADVEVKRDGEVLRKIQWGMAVPVDPGKHAVTAKAAGMKGWDGSIDVKEGQDAKIAVPPLVKDTSPVVVAPPVASAGPAPTSAVTTGSAAPPPPSDLAPSGGSSQKTVGLVVSGAGVVVFGVGVILGAVAKSKANDTGTNCVGDACNQAGLDTRKSALDTGKVGTVLGVVGLLGVAGGVALFLTAPKDAPATGLRVSPMWGGLAMGGGF